MAECCQEESLRLRSCARGGKQGIPTEKNHKSLVAVAIIQFCHLGGGVRLQRYHSQQATTLFQFFYAIASATEDKRCD